MAADNRVVAQFSGGGDTKDPLFDLLNHVQHYVLINVEQVLARDIRYAEEYTSSGGYRVSSLLCIIPIYLCTAFKFLVHNTCITTSTQERDVVAATQAIRQIFGKLLSKGVYNDLLDGALRSVNTMPYSVNELLSELPKKISTNCSAHGVLHNLAIKLVDNVSSLLNLLYKCSNPVDSDLGPLLESLNCTLGSLNRALDPLPGGKHAMEGELYNVHLIPHKLPIVPTLISEPTVSYCCCSYKQLTLR
ncbi:hypothetical protein [Anaplasma bovis]|uniref:hypothetical protein n=1 Tax=Anaplasma bovis TaxID=186733 RepID=UPI002FF0BCE6